MADGSSSDSIPALQSCSDSEDDSSCDSDSESVDSVETLGSLPEYEYLEPPKTIYHSRKNNKRDYACCPRTGKLDETEEDRLGFFNLKELCRWILNSTCCIKCRKQFNHQDLLYFAQGFATNAVLCCNNCSDKKKKVCQAKTVSSVLVKAEYCYPANYTMLPTDKYASNYNEILACQRLGVGSSGADELAGQLR